MRSKYQAGSRAAYALPSGVVQLPAVLLGQGQKTALELLAGSLALQYCGVVSPAECAALTQAVYAAKSDWNSNFEGIQFSLGRAFYVHLEQDEEDEYFDNAAQSVAVVERAVPGLHARMADLCQRLVPGPVVQRPEWCGAGVHIFPAGGYCAQHGGDLHFDVEGLTEEQLAAETPALTMVLMLQPAVAGGELRVWDKRYEGEAEVDQAPGRGELCAYKAGDLVVIDSWRLHQIMPFTGAVDRISATLHAVQNPAGQWEVWF